MVEELELEPVEGAPDPGGGDCVGCGRCCHHGPSTVHLLDTDEARVLARPGGEALLARLTVLDDRPPGRRFVRNEGRRCAAPGVSASSVEACSSSARREAAQRPWMARASSPETAASTSAGYVPIAWSATKTTGRSSRSHFAFRSTKSIVASSPATSRRFHE